MGGFSVVVDAAFPQQNFPLPSRVCSQLKSKRPQSASFVQGSRPPLTPSGQVAALSSGFGVVVASAVVVVTTGTTVVVVVGGAVDVDCPFPQQNFPSGVSSHVRSYFRQSRSFVHVSMPPATPSGHCAAFFSGLVVVVETSGVVVGGGPQQNLPPDVSVHFNSNRWQSMSALHSKRFQN